MAGSVNKVILVGRLGKDPEVKYTPSGAAVAKFSLATDESFKDKTGEKQDRTEWHNIVAWNKLAEICGEYLTKGKLIYIEGSIRSRQWQDQSGTNARPTKSSRIPCRCWDRKVSPGVAVDRAVRRWNAGPPQVLRPPKSRLRRRSRKSATTIFRFRSR